MAEPVMGTDLEDLTSFRQRLRGWLKENMPLADARPAPYHQVSDSEELALVAHHRGESPG